MARKKTNPTPTPIDPAELEAEVNRAAAADPEAGQRLQSVLTIQPAARGGPFDIHAALGRFLEFYDALDKLGVIEWIRKRRAGGS